MNLVVGSVEALLMESRVLFQALLVSTFICVRYFSRILLVACDDGWTYFGHTSKCYKPTESNLSRADAVKACKALNPTANLVTIHIEPNTPTIRKSMISCYLTIIFMGFSLYY